MVRCVVAQARTTVVACSWLYYYTASEMVPKCLFFNSLHI
uniref:Uncharacterized protein n=1 Tax=Anguilla anguilla TaxID=7936 RepID=A0A0E9WGF4_ANGAN